MNDAQEKRAAWLVLIVLIVAVSLAACVTPTKPATTLDYLEQAEASLTAGWEALGEAIALGAVQINSADHRRYYNLLARADSLLDQAWQAYSGGDDNGARTQIDIALSIYNQIRPSLLAAAGGG